MNQGSNISDAHRQEAESRGIAAQGASSATTPSSNRPPASTRSQAPRSLPQGMDRAVTSGQITYDFKVGRNAVQVYFTTRPASRDTPDRAERTLGFTIDGSYDMQRDRLTVEERGEISRRVTAALRHQMSLEENAAYSCSAWTDGEEDFRALAYARLGFSRPAFGSSGMSQFAVIKNGRIDSESSAQKLKELEARYNSTPAQIQKYEQDWQATIDRASEARQDARRARRGQA